MYLKTYLSDTQPSQFSMLFCIPTTMKRLVVLQLCQFLILRKVVHLPREVLRRRHNGLQEVVLVSDGNLNCFSSQNSYLNALINYRISAALLKYQCEDTPLRELVNLSLPAVMKKYKILTIRRYSSHLISFYLKSAENFLK